MKPISYPTSEVGQGDYWTAPADARSGRCRSCGLLYVWRAGKGRELRRAHCECGARLTQTVGSLLMRGSARLAIRDHMDEPGPARTALPLFRDSGGRA